MMGETANNQVQTAPIPRPWLSKSKKGHVASMSSGNSGPYHHHHWKETCKTNNDRAILLLDKPKFTISWMKLSNCFCLGGGRQRNLQKISTATTALTTTTNSNRPCQHGYRQGQPSCQQQQPNGPRQPPLTTHFPGLAGVFRRHSSFSLPGDTVLEDCFPRFAEEAIHYTEECHHHRHDSCSVVSDFTESETSSYFSVSDVEDGRRRENRHPVVEAASERLPGSGTHEGVVTGHSPTKTKQRAESNHETVNSIPKDATTRTPTPSRIAATTKPPMISNRSRSAGLPPLNPAPLSATNSITGTMSGTEPFLRSRTDTGDFTGTTNATGTTNTSRHRRNDHHFTFSNRSISEIWKGDAAAAGKGSAAPLPPPPSYVSFHHQVPERSTIVDPSNKSGGMSGSASPCKIGGSVVEGMVRRRSSEISVLGWDESCGEDGAYSLWGDDDRDDDYDDDIDSDVDSNLVPKEEKGNDKEAGSFFVGLHPKPTDDSQSRHFEITERGRSNSKKSSRDRNSKSKLQKEAGKPKQGTLKATATTETVSGYLRKHPALDCVSDGQLVLSGWVAALIRPEFPRLDRYPEENTHLITEKLCANDIYYLRVVVLSTGQASLLLHRSDGTVEHSFVIHRDWTLELKEVNCRIGRSVSICSASASLLLLPVCLGDCFFTSSGDIVAEEKFRQLRSELFVAVGDFAPDEQMDSAMYLMFSIDSLVKQRAVY
mmetsp:Transcript_17562/g.32507  ORF Transcript_17562/g.32507 Transcript_17562/m.32507 type:complete len:713 (-) Transcript_17562:267-2405(-)